MKDASSGIKFIATANLYQPDEMTFLLQKKHTSINHRALSLKSNFELNTKQPIKLHNTNFFNYFQEITSS